MLDHRLHSPDDWAATIRALERWDAGGGWVSGLHAGDLGWALREADGDALDGLHCWWDGDVLAAVALTEGPVARPRMAPGRTEDRDLAEQVAAQIEALPGPELWSDADAGTALRDVLQQRGWSADVGDPWVALHLPLDGLLDGGLLEVAHSAEEARGCVTDRVLVQRRGFRHSTFTEGKWHRMAAGPGYRPELDLLVRGPDGSPAAAATAWLGAEGGTAILEPVATHPDHRRGGHARHVVLACARAAHALGATDLCVATPASNDAAVTAYTRTGFTVVERFTAMTLGQVA